MVAKLALGLVVLTIIVAVAVVAAFWYFNQHDARRHEKDLKQMEHTEKVLESTETDPIERELERDKRQ